MDNYIRYKDLFAFHPGYYIEELIEQSGLTQVDFAKRLDTTAKNLSLLVRGKQSLSVDMALKLSKMLGTSIQYWLNLQNAYDSVLAQIHSDKQLEEEKDVLKLLGYEYFRDNFGLPNLPRMLAEQVQQLRSFLQVASLTVLTERDMAVSFRSSTTKMSKQNIAKANTMVQIATNKALKVEAPPYDKKKFKQAIEYALSQTRNHNSFYPRIRAKFHEAGVILVILPNLTGSKTNGATKKIGKSVMMMVNDRRLYADSFWFTLLHEAGHVMNGDFGISFESESGNVEKVADKYAEDTLIPPDLYYNFVREQQGHFTEASIRAFADKIKRDPGIVLGRLENDAYVQRGNSMQSLKCKYYVSISKV